MLLRTQDVEFGERLVLGGVTITPVLLRRSRHQLLRRVVLELDGVRVGLGGGVDEAFGLRKVAVVVRACLRDDVCGFARSHRPSRDVDGLGHSGV
jgi:hypothetical protein